MKKIDRLRFGTAGIPVSAKGTNTLTGIEAVRKVHSLECMELEFVHSVNIKEDKAPGVKEVANKNDVLLTCHGQYYINLASLEPDKIEASKQRILNAARRAHQCGGWSMVFHAGFYMKRDPKKVYDIIEKGFKDVMKRVEDEGLDIWIRPETTGKGTQFGDLDELLRISEKFDKVMPCIDFSHIHARSNGKYNTTQEFNEILEKVEKVLGKEGLNNMHIHLSGIEYGEKGEKHHLTLDNSDMNYKDLIRCWKDFKIKGAVICESPNIEEDAKLIRDFYSKLK
jgi:deoxyribonuclease IV